MFLVDIRSVPALFLIFGILLVPFVLWIGAKELVLLPGGIFAIIGIAFFVFTALPRWQQRVRIVGLAIAVAFGVVSSVLAIKG